ncbi:MAG: NUDIX domain-containing protein, partial [Candidatus Gracilibacteria bacterium]|nr:NUDIX domain-containing protein [Candidatus Gracilibacteria bacterium]
MAEIIDYYDLSGNKIGEGDRKSVLKDQESIARKTLTSDVVSAVLQGQSEIPDENFAVRSVMMFLFDLQNNMYVVQRSDDKKENPGLMDKSAGGHVVSGDSYDKTLLKELDEELGVTGVITENETDFMNQVKQQNLQKTAVFLKMQEIRNFISKRTTLKEGDFWYKLFNVGLYVGFYNGEVVFKDGEAVGESRMSIQDLKQDIGNHPEKYTEDILKIIEQYNILSQVMKVSQ